jgi:glycosyltransferase involved in cell wall biosynthesis
LIYNGCYIDKLKIKTHPHTNTFGFIGQIKKSKGIELLLKSFSKLENLSWRLIIAGKINKNYLEYLQEINNSVRIEYVGYIDSASFFEMIDVLVVPSLWNEPFGRVVLESIINKKPVIASNMGGIKELLSKNKNFIFHPKEDSLTDLIKKIILNKDFLGEFNFQKSLLDKFDIEKTVDQYLDVFNEILKE